MLTIVLNEIVFNPNPPVKFEQVSAIAIPYEYTSDLSWIPSNVEILAHVKCADGVVLLVVARPKEEKRA